MKQSKVNQPGSQVFVNEEGMAQVKRYQNYRRKKDGVKLKNEEAIVEMVNISATFFLPELHKLEQQELDKMKDLV